MTLSKGACIHCARLGRADESHRWRQDDPYIHAQPGRATGFVRGYACGSRHERACARGFADDAAVVGPMRSNVRKPCAHGFACRIILPFRNGLHTRGAGTGECERVCTHACARAALAPHRGPLHMTAGERHGRSAVLCHGKGFDDGICYRDKNRATVQDLTPKSATGTGNRATVTRNQRKSATVARRLATVGALIDARHYRDKSRIRKSLEIRHFQKSLILGAQSPVPRYRIRRQNHPPWQENAPR